MFDVTIEWRKVIMNTDILRQKLMQKHTNRTSNTKKNL